MESDKKSPVLRAIFSLRRDLANGVKELISEMGDVAQGGVMRNTAYNPAFLRNCI
jgi:hypothetical protein